MTSEIMAHWHQKFIGLGMFIAAGLGFNRLGIILGRRKLDKHYRCIMLAVRLADARTIPKQSLPRCKVSQSGGGEAS